MRLIFYISSFFALLCASGTPLNTAVLKFYLWEESSMIRLHEFYPEGVPRLKKAIKPHMDYGVPTPRLQELMDATESLPVETRLFLIGQLSKIVRRPISEEYMATTYQKSLLAASLIDVRLLRLLLRFATNFLEEGERHLRTACDIIEHLREKFPDGSFDRIYPDYVLAWYNGMGNSVSSHSEKQKHAFTMTVLTDPEIRRKILSPNTAEPVFVQATPQTWRIMILQQRMERLLKTGYETLP